MMTRFRPTPQDTGALRHAFGRFATGVTVVTTMTPDGPVGMTANSFSSVSLDPALVLWCIDRRSDRFDAFRAAERYAIHVLARDQAALSTGFARDGGHFRDILWTEGADGIPELDGVLARFDCRLVAAHDAGDHVILVGAILEAAERPGDPLLFAGGAYGGLVSA